MAKLKNAVEILGPSLNEAEAQVLGFKLRNFMKKHLGPHQAVQLSMHFQLCVLTTDITPGQSTEDAADQMIAIWQDFRAHLNSGN